MIILSGAVFLFSSFQISYEQDTSLEMKSGIASGDIKNDSAIIWSKSNADAIMNVEYKDSSRLKHSFSNPILKTEVNSLTNYTGHIKLTNLLPNTNYYYNVWFSDSNNSSMKSENVSGKFRTAPNPDSDLKNINFI